MNTALYAYAVIGAGTLPPRGEAILPGAALLTLAEGDIAALASPVPRAWFEDGPECRTDDPSWLAERATAHHKVVAAMAGAALPLAFGALFSGEEPLRAWLRQGAPRFAAALARVRGRSEWSIQLSEDVSRHAGWLRGHDPDLAELATRGEAASPGTAFMLRRRLDRAVDEARLARRHEAARALEAMLQSTCQDVSSSAPRGTEGVAAFNILLPEEAAPALRAALAEEAQALSPTGLALALSGPWPPYAFAREAVAHG